MAVIAEKPSGYPRLPTPHIGMLPGTLIRKWLAIYEVFVASKGDTSKIPGFCRQLGVLRTDLSGRNPPHLSLDELGLIMDWKLTRGKFRPLKKLVLTNTNTENVTEVCGIAPSDVA
jgi:hypothetical protein